MSFESDIFVSYAHIDNEQLAEGQQGWISNLHRALEVRLAQLLGKKPRIWRDPKLQGNDYFADELVERLPKVALVVSILSPRYIRSEWCTREIEEFTRAAAASGGIRVDNKARIFKVVKTPIPLEEHPDEVRELLGYDFFVLEPETGRPRELSQQSGGDRQRLYWAKLDDLAYDIRDLLERLEAGNGASGEAPPADDGESIYLAETAFDLKPRRDALKREIQSQGFSVLPDRTLPLVGSECEAVVRQQLSRCRMSLHLIGQNYGVVPEGTTRSIAELQSELAVERGAGPGFSRLVWMPSGLSTEDDRQSQLIEHLRTDASVQEGMDLLEVPFEDFQGELRSWLHPVEKEPEALPEIDAGDELIRVYLICDQRDAEATLPVEDYLFDQGFEVIPSLFEGDEAQVRQDHEENLVTCDAALLYYGAGNELWLRRKLREIQRSAGFGRSKPMLAKAIYVGPPESPRKQRLRTREAQVVRQVAADFEPDQLEPFIRQLRDRGVKSA